VSAIQILAQDREAGQQRGVARSQRGAHQQLPSSDAGSRRRAAAAWAAWAALSCSTSLLLSSTFWRRPRVALLGELNVAGLLHDPGSTAPPPRHCLSPLHPGRADPAWRSPAAAHLHRRCHALRQSRLPGSRQQPAWLHQGAGNDFGAPPALRVPELTLILRAGVPQTSQKSAFSFACSATQSIKAHHEDGLHSPGLEC